MVASILAIAIASSVAMVAPPEATAAGLARVTSATATTVTPANAAEPRCIAWGKGCVTVVGPSTTVRPRDVIVGTRGAALTAARNEFESFQVVISGGPADTPEAPNPGIRGLVVASAPLIGAGGSIPAPVVYREGYYTVSVPCLRDCAGVDRQRYTPPADAEGASGDWPDPLIPVRDVFYGQERFAFSTAGRSFDVPAGQNRVAWIDVYVPRAQPVGRYSGAITLSATGLPATEVPVQVDLLGVTLPSTSTLRSLFAMNTEDAAPGKASDPCKAHPSCVTEADRYRLYGLYARAGLENRISISNPWPLLYDGRPPGDAAGAGFVSHLLPLITPAGDGPTRLPGARLTTLHVNGYRTWHCLQECVTDWGRFAKKHGFSERMVLYACDEPGRTAAYWDLCRAAGHGLRADVDVDDDGTADMTRLVTAHAANAAAAGESDTVDVLVTLLNEMHGKTAADCPRAGCGNSPFPGDQRDHPAYATFLGAEDQPGSRRNEVWIYSSCMSAGCDAAPAPYWDAEIWDGWAGHALDQLGLVHDAGTWRPDPTRGTQSRAMGWLAYRYRATGLLYWNTTQLLASAWTNSNHREHDPYGTHAGDGTLFYPGIAAGRGRPGDVLYAPAIGPVGGTDVPLESIRLKRVRDGVEDYELLRLVPPGRAAEAAEIVRDLYPSAFATPSDAQLQAARGAIIALLDPVVPPATGRLVFASARTGNGDIYAVHPDGSRLANLTPGTSVDSRPAWSPDGSRIAFTRRLISEGGLPNDEIFVMASDGSGQVNLSRHPGLDSKPTWSPDGSRIAFVRRVVVGGVANDEIFSVRASDGGDPRNLTNDAAQDYDPAWSPSGGLIAYARRTGAAADIWVMGPDGTGKARVTDDPGDEDLPAWKPGSDGILAFDRYTAGQYDLVQLDRETGVETPVTLTDAHETDPVWSPDGRHLAYVRGLGTSTGIALMPVAGGAAVTVSDAAGADTGPDWNAWSADLAVTGATPHRSVAVGDQLSVSFGYRNDGPSASTATVLSVAVPTRATVLGLPAGCSLTGAMAYGGRSVGGTVRCALGTLARGAAGSRGIVLGAVDAGVATLRATLAGAVADPDGTDDAGTSTFTGAFPAGQTARCSILGSAGADVLTGTAGGDSLCGFGGADALQGNGGDDAINGGPGTDAAVYSGAAGGVVISLRYAGAYCKPGIACGVGYDRLIGVEDATGSRHTDEIYGSAGPNVVRAGPGDDVVSGYLGNDRLYGQDGKDTLWGREASSGASSGSDLLVGGGGDDSLFGQDGADTLVGEAGTDGLAGGTGVDRCWQEAQTGPGGGDC